MILEATIDERRFITDARVLRSVPLLDAAALAALNSGGILRHFSTPLPCGS